VDNNQLATERTKVMTEPIEVKAAEPVAEVKAPEVKEDLLTRVSKFEKKAAAEVKPVEEDFKFDVNEINSIEDPKAKEYATKAYKSFQKGFNHKFQELSETRKALETRLNEVNATSNWSPEKVQQLLNNPDFVKAAQSVAGVTHDEYSALTDAEKAKLNTLENEITRLRTLNEQSLNSQQDAQLRSKYANYEPQAIDSLVQDLSTGKVRATREHLYKVLYHDENVRRAYEMGLADAQGGINEKINSSSADGFKVLPSSGDIKREQNESSENYFKRLAFKNLSKVSNQKAAK